VSTNESSLSSIAGWVTSFFSNRSETVAKGDVPGHEFHGNQWSKEAVAQLRERSLMHADKTRQVNAPYTDPMRITWDSGKDAHQVNSEKLADIANKIENDPSKTLNEHLADLKQEHDGLKQQQAKDLLSNYFNRKSHFTTDAIEQAMEVIKPIADKENLSVEKQIIQKGDVPGHPFHGNQYQTVEAMASDIKAKYPRMSSVSRGKDRLAESVKRGGDRSIFNVGESAHLAMDANELSKQFNSLRSNHPGADNPDTVLASSPSSSVTMNTMDTLFRSSEAPDSLIQNALEKSFKEYNGNTKSLFDSSGKIRPGRMDEINKQYADSVTDLTQKLTLADSAKTKLLSDPTVENATSFINAVNDATTQMSDMRRLGLFSSAVDRFAGDKTVAETNYQQTLSLAKQTYGLTDAKSLLPAITGLQKNVTDAYSQINKVLEKTGFDNLTPEVVKGLDGKYAQVAEGSSAISVLAKLPNFDRTTSYFDSTPKFGSSGKTSEENQKILTDVVDASHKLANETESGKNIVSAYATLNDLTNELSAIKSASDLAPTLGKWAGEIDNAYRKAQTAYNSSNYGTPEEALAQSTMRLLSDNKDSLQELENKINYANSYEEANNLMSGSDSRPLEERLADAEGLLSTMSPAARGHGFDGNTLSFENTFKKADGTEQAILPSDAQPSRITRQDFTNTYDNLRNTVTGLKAEVASNRASQLMGDIQKIDTANPTDEDFAKIEEVKNLLSESINSYGDGYDLTNSADATRLQGELPKLLASHANLDLVKNIEAKASGPYYYSKLMSIVNGGGNNTTYKPSTLAKKAVDGYDRLRSELLPTGQDESSLSSSDKALYDFYTSQINSVNSMADKIELANQLQRHNL
jgi:hypothetical protein